MTLDKAWAEAEAALPDGWVMALHSTGVGLHAACAYHVAWTHDSHRGVVVDTTDGPAATLDALTERLRKRGEMTVTVDLEGTPTLHGWDEDEWTNREGMPEFNGSFR